ncbi:hypothetical protein AC578_784 [Pseudocercospora eumusae]|uniref:diacylglycerol O-acyltransferase n=1 Tax=Pseudocercospora eumusae TaxID=321146 RepID=A0A139GTX0_9PEZI|nr:hypothetical protein AC578_784 [Pseudocercospora eumusae]
MSASAARHMESTDVEAAEREPADMIDREDPDESVIKESPPRLRNSSSPRPLGEVIDEPSPGSPTLRHPKGRLETKNSQDSYVVRDRSPLEHALPNGDGKGLPIKTNGLQTPIETPVRTTGTRTPDTFDGVGSDETPRSPTRRAHKRISSNELNGGAKKAKGMDGTAAERLDPGDVLYDHVRNKSGENLASIKVSDDYYLSLQQREDKPPSSKPPRQAKRNSELTSGRRVGEGWSRSKIRFAPLNVPLQRRLQTLLVLLHTLSIAGGLALFFMLCGIPILWPLLLPYLLYCLLSRASIDGKLSQRSDRLRSSKIWSLFGSYFPARLHRSQPLEATRKYIFGYHPHGIISHGAFAAFATEALGFSQLFPGITNTLLTLDSNFRIPLYRDYALRMGLASVSRESCENILSHGGPNGEGMGRAITIVVGGARESLDAKPYTLRLVLKRRKGFVKLAIRTGADLVPVLAFGENDLYDQFDASSHPYVHKAQLLVKKFMGFTVPLFHARGVFNYDVGMMPYRRPINIVVGKPIPIIQAKNPDPSYVDEIHAKYVEELERIWDDWKDTFARNRQGELEIVE